MKMVRSGFREGVWFRGVFEGWFRELKKRGVVVVGK